MKKALSFIALGFAIATMQSCTQEETPTKLAMQGNWELVSAKDASGNDITSQIAFPVTAIQLTDDNGMLGTQGPMFTRIVYGDSKWIEVSGKIKQVFDYANLRMNTGEFFVGENVQPTFTVEAKLQATAAAGGVLSDILQLVGVNTSFFQQVIYHKFTNVTVTFPDKGEASRSFFQNSNNNNNNNGYNTMVWEFTDNTQAFYNYKDQNGNSVVWNGFPVANFKRGTYTFRKFTTGLNDFVKSRQ
jgi:hypothetical protein